MQKIGLFKKSKATKPKSKLENRTETITKTYELQVDESLSSSSFYSTENLDELRYKDKKMYIEFFGSEEEKQELLREQEQREKEKLIEEERLKEQSLKEALELEMKETQQRLYTINTFHFELGLVVDIVSEQIKKVYAQPKYLFNLYDSHMIEVLKKYHLKVTSDLGYIMENKETIALNEITKLIEEQDTYIDSSLYAYFENFQSHAKNRVYPIETILKMENSFKEVANFVFDYMENTLVQDSYAFYIKVPLEDGFNQENTYTVIFSNERKFENKYTKGFAFRIYGDYYTWDTLLENGENQEQFDTFLIQNFLKQWNDYVPYLKTEKVKGIKSSFIAESKLYNLDENLDSWSI